MSVSSIAWPCRPAVESRFGMLGEGGGRCHVLGFEGKKVAGGIWTRLREAMTFQSRRNWLQEKSEAAYSDHPYPDTHPSCGAFIHTLGDQSITVLSFPRCFLSFWLFLWGTAG